MAQERRHPMGPVGKGRAPLVIGLAIGAVMVGLLSVLVIRSLGSSSTTTLSSAPGSSASPTTARPATTLAPATTGVPPVTTVAGSTSPAEAVAFRPGAEANQAVWSRDFPLPPVTGRSVTVTSVPELNARVAAASPGDEIVLADGTYQGEVTLAANGEPGRPITIRAATKHLAVIKGNDSWNVTGSHLVVRDLFFDGGRGGQFGLLLIKGTNNRFSGNRFDKVGYTADDTDTRSIFRLETDVDSFNLIDANLVNQPNTVFAYLSHGTGYTVFTHNVITGPNGMGGRFGSYLIKSGCCEDDRPSNLVFQYNTVDRFGPAVPEAIDEKTPRAFYLSNKMPDSILYLRHGDGSSVIGNWMEGLYVDGAEHRIEGNLIRRDSPWENNSNPLVALNAASTTPRHDPVQRTQIIGNVIAHGGAPGGTTNQERNIGVWGAPENANTIKGNVIRNNVFVRVAPWGAISDGTGFIGYANEPAAQVTFLSGNTINDNRLVCAECPAPSFAGRSGNRVDAALTLDSLPNPVGPKKTDLATITAFTAQAGPNGTVKLSWDVTGAWYVTIDNGVGLAARGPGTKTLTTSATSFTLTAYGPAGSTAQKVSLIP